MNMTWPCIIEVRWNKHTVIVPTEVFNFSSAIGLTKSLRIDSTIVARNVILLQKERTLHYLCLLACGRSLTAMVKGKKSEDDGLDCERPGST